MKKGVKVGISSGKMMVKNGNPTCQNQGNRLGPNRRQLTWVITSEPNMPYGATASATNTKIVVKAAGSVCWE